MKTITLKTILFASVLSFAGPLVAQVNKVSNTVTRSNSTLQGGVNGGGGDDVALEFQQALVAAAETAKSQPELMQVLKKNNILGNAAKAHIVIVDDALDVKVRDLIQSSVAVNIPSEQRILINRQRWNGIKDEKIENAIALHEALSLKKLEQTGYYPYTTQYLQLVGESESSLTTALKVNRLQQLQATGGGDAFVTLRKFFEEAREPVTTSSIANEFTKLGDKVQCRITSGGKMSPIKFEAINVYLNEQENGPLFPKEQGWRFVTANLEGNIPKPDSYAWGLLSMTEKDHEIVQQSHDLQETVWPSYKLTIRKNNGHITFHTMTSRYRYAPQDVASYGYCF